MRRRMSIWALALLAAAVATGAARADGYGVTFSFGPGFGPPGTVVTFHATGCVTEGPPGYLTIDLYPPGDTADAHPKAEKRYPTRSDGTVEGRFTVPALAPGRYDFIARCDRVGGPVQLVKSPFILESPTPAPSAGAHPSATAAPRHAPSATPSARVTQPAPSSHRSAAPQALRTPPGTAVTATAAGSGRSAGRTPLALVALVLAAGAGAATAWSHRASRVVP